MDDSNGSPPLTCRVHRRPDGTVTVDVHGDIDVDTASELTNCLHEQLELPRRPVTLDVALTHTTFLGARGITALVDAAGRSAGLSVGFQVTGCSPRMLRLFDLVGVREVLRASGHISG
jgi:anti-anti-sigma factor